MSDDKIFPTRTGESVGSATERTMLNEAQGPNSTRTVIRNHSDGSSTRLRTRDGFPEFLTVGVSEDIEKSLICAAIPVSDTGEWGFYKDGTASPPFTAMDYHVEAHPASAELEVEQTRIRYHYNKREVTDWTAPKDKIHPGNRIWCDHRTTGRTTGKVVSWWSPFNTCLLLPYGWYDADRPWLGDGSVSTMRYGSDSVANYLAIGTWEGCRGIVFVDGRKVCDFEEVVFCAAYDKENNRIVALTTTEIRQVGEGVKTAEFALSSYYFATQTYVKEPIVGSFWRNEYRCPMPSFSPSAGELLWANTIFISDEFDNDYFTCVFRMNTETLDQTFERKVELETYPAMGMQTNDQVIAMRYADDGTTILYAREVYEDVSQFEYKVEVFIEGTKIAKKVGTHVSNSSTVSDTLCKIVAADGRGGYMIAYLEGYEMANAEGNVTTSHVSSEVGEVVSYDSGPLETFIYANPNVDLPIYFMRAGQGFGQWVAFENAVLPVDMYGDFLNSMTCWFMDAHGLVTSYGGPSQKELCITLATSPDGKTTIAGARIQGGTTHYYRTVNPPPIWNPGGTTTTADHFNVFASFSEIRLISGANNQHNTLLDFPWGGSYKGLNSPVWYARRPKITRKETA